MSRLGRLTLITVSKDEDLIVIGRELDMAVTLFLDRVQWSDLVFTSVPTRQLSPWSHRS